MDPLQVARQLQNAELKLRELFEAVLPILEHSPEMYSVIQTMAGVGQTLKREAERLMETETARAELSVGEGI